MLGYRILVALGVFGIASLCALVATYWSPVWMVTVALWFGAVGFVVLGFRTLLGRVGQAESRDPPWPAPIDPDSNPFVPGGPSMGPSPASWPVPPTVPFEKPVSVGDYSVSGPPPRPDEPSAAELTDTVLASGRRIVRGVRNVVLVLSLLVLVPVTLLLVLVSVFQFRDGHVGNGLIALGSAVFVGVFAGGMIRRRKSLPLVIGD